MGLFFVLLLSVLGPSLASGTGPHRLQYELTETQDASLRSTFIAKEYLYHQLILCNGSEKVGKTEIRGLLARVVLGDELGADMTSGFAEDRKALWRRLTDIREKQRQKGDKRGSHSLQEVRGCEIQEDTRTRAFRWFFYNGEPFLFYDETADGWEAPQSSFHTLALEIKKSWDTESTDNKNSWAQVRGDLCGNLRRHRESWTGFSERTALNVTCSRASDGVVSVMCWASGSSPWNISLVWLQDDEPLNPDAQQPGGVLYAENGTYGAWVALRVPQGEEQRVTCFVEHNWNCTVTCGNLQVHQHPEPTVSLGVTVIVPTVFGAVLLVAAVLLWYFWFRKTSPGKSPGLDSLQGLMEVVMPDYQDDKLERQGLLQDVHGAGPKVRLRTVGIGYSVSRSLCSVPTSRNSTEDTGVVYTERRFFSAPPLSTLCNSASNYSSVKSCNDSTIIGLAPTSRDSTKDTGVVYKERRFFSAPPLSTLCNSASNYSSVKSCNNSTIIGLAPTSRDSTEDTGVVYKEHRFPSAPPSSSSSRLPPISDL